MWKQGEQMGQEIMKIIIDFTVGNGKMIKEMAQGNNNLRIKWGNMLEHLWMINIMGEEN